MTRLARLVVPHHPHHLTQRGNRRQLTFFSETHWQWSSARAHLLGKDNKLVSVEPMLKRVSDWENYISFPEHKSNLKNIRLHSRTGRPQGDIQFIDKLESLMQCKIHVGKSGPKPKDLASGTRGY